VIQGVLLGITKRDIEAGTNFYVDEDGTVVADDVGNKYLGKVVSDAAATDSFVRVRLSQ